MLELSVWPWIPALHKVADFWLSLCYKSHSPTISPMTHLSTRLSSLNPQKSSHLLVWYKDTDRVEELVTNRKLLIMMTKERKAACTAWDIVKDLRQVQSSGKRKLKGNLDSASLLAQTVKNLPEMRGPWVWSLGQEDPLENGMATLSSILTWRIPWTEGPGRLQSMGLQSDRTEWLTHSSYFSKIWSTIERKKIRSGIYC